MKTYIINWRFLFASILLLVAGCKKTDSGPSLDDYFLNYPIEEVPVTQDYVVGAFYYSWGTFNPNITEVPVVGPYNSPSGKIDPTIMAKHIEQATQGGVDYFVFQMRSFNRDNGNFLNDSNLINVFEQQNTAGKMKFAIYYNFSAGSYGISATSPLEKDAGKLNQFIDDISRLSSFFDNPNYEKVDGKILLYINNSNQLYSDDNPAIYKAVRDKLAEKGIELYIVGYQERWSPPARYAFRFKGGVDAVYEQSYSSQINSWDRWYLLPQMIDQNWKYTKAYFKDSLGVDFIPNISPAANWLITNTNSNNPNFDRSDSGKLYRTLCNVCKMNASDETRLILIDSWNQWDQDTQLEPAQSYGNLYLDITKEEFKK